MLPYLFAEFHHRAGRVLGIVLGIALGVTLYLALTAAATGFREAARQPLSSVGADLLLTRPAMGMETQASAQTTHGARLPFGMDSMKLSDLEKVQHIQGIDEAAGALLLWDFGSTNYQTVLGVDAGQSQIGPDRARDWVVSGRFLEKGESGVAVVDKHYAAFFKLKPGDTVSIGGRSFKVVGVVEAREGSQAAAANFYVPLSDAQGLVQMGPDAIDQFYIRVTQASAAEEVVQRVRGTLGEVTAISEQSIVQIMGGISQISDRFAGIASLVALLGGLIMTWLALSGSVNERTNEIGLMKAVGWKSAHVERYFILEGVTLSLLGGLIGLTLGGLATLGLRLIQIDLPGLTATTPSSLAFQPAVYNKVPFLASFSGQAVFLSLGVAILGGALASWFVARRAASIKPAVALRRSG
jgi:putative ABC transport system permease protein